jgi:pentapeptide MXKDX repeat protein
MAGKGKKIGLGILAVLVLAGGGIGIYAWYFASQHKTEYGKKGKITKKAESKIQTFQKRVLKCKNEVFSHEKLPYKPKKDSGTDGWKKATEALVMGLKTCLRGQKSADGKGYSGKMDPKHLDALLKHEQCPSFADNLMKFKKCQFLFEELVDHAGFDDGLGLDDMGDEDAPEGMKADATEADAMEADAMEADAMEADAMKVEGMEADAMEADAMKAEGMGADAMKADAMK